MKDISGYMSSQSPIHIKMIYNKHEDDDENNHDYNDDNNKNDDH